ncbi:prephenate dehydratase [SAR92 clade bacterium H231]|jgi:chorismate mutase/prephenate dehydratase|nr:prephenate dehydratase [Porticoccaceae bacterium]MCT2533934.1 prephenate dehydratase [SAR92 clade bacterium H231]MBT6320305.1 prephenate dehydratase [Porticoccaceae bacterium]MBT7257432.1 prephenate dehydratase [Porticoccaceae bacterium]MBT7904537.1 prephenate dehydratase [Porticoccaceae bacterium]
MAEDNPLLGLRDKIDALDLQIMQAISDRARCAQQVAEVKKGQGDLAYYKPEREAQVLRHIMEKNAGPLDNEEMARLFRQIMSACLALEQPIRVAFLGPEGTFTQEAALKHFGDSAISVPQSAIDEVFREVLAGACNYGVVPVENSTEGVISHTLDSFMDSSLKICGEVELRIHQHFMIGPNTNKDSVTRVYSHAQSLAQCRQWLNSNYPNIERVAVSSNAEAAKRVQGEWNSAAIAGDMACELYNLEKMREKIEDRPDNSTRFLIIGRESVPRSGDDRTSIVVSVHNKPGALHDLLEPFRRYNVDMTRLESRPSRNSKWSYVFFIDLIGHIEDQPVADVLEELSSSVAELKILGSYPRAVL